MAATSIQWCDVVWNPTTGCRKVSPGCKHCYAEGVADRFWATQYPPVPARHACAHPLETRPRRFTDVQVHPDRLDQPLRWREPRRVFVNSMSDLFHEDIPDGFIADVFGVMAAAPQHTFQVLTKRPERMREMLSAFWFEMGVAEGLAAWVEDGKVADPGVGWPLPNTWLGVSVEDQERADERIPLLLETPAAVRFLSCEPLLGPVDLGNYLTAAPISDKLWCPTARRQVDVIGSARCTCTTGHQRGQRISWVIVGGESGPKARPMDLAWARSLVEQGRAAAVPVFVKQLGRRPVGRWYAGQVHDGHRIDGGLRDSHGGDPDEWPEDLRVREFPGA
jgi:protein gp37